MNPCASNSRRKKGKGKQSRQRQKASPYNAEEAAQVIELSKALGLRDHALITLLIRTGVRVGEALALVWEDINFEARTVPISKSWDYRHQRLGPTKTGVEREVDLTPYTVEVLSQLREETHGLDGEPVFSKDGNRLSCEFARRQYYKIRLRDDVVLHNLRDTYATLSIAKGDNILDVSKQTARSREGFNNPGRVRWLVTGGT